MSKKIILIRPSHPTLIVGKDYLISTIENIILIKYISVKNNISKNDLYVWVIGPVYIIA